VTVPYERRTVPYDPYPTCRIHYRDVLCGTDCIGPDIPGQRWAGAALEIARGWGRSSAGWAWGRRLGQGVAWGCLGLLSSTCAADIYYVVSGLKHPVPYVPYQNMVGHISNDYGTVPTVPYRTVPYLPYVPYRTYRTLRIRCVCGLDEKCTVPYVLFPVREGASRCIGDERTVPQADT
jgi:hypothetical protein